MDSEYYREQDNCKPLDSASSFHHLQKAPAVVSKDSPDKPAPTYPVQHDVGSSQSSGYSSTDVSRCSGASGASRMPLPVCNPQRDSLASSVNGSSIYFKCNFEQHFYINRDAVSTQHTHLKTMDENALTSANRFCGGEGPPCVLDPLSQRALNRLTPELIGGIEPSTLLLYLHKHELVNRDESEIIRNGNLPTTDRNWKILHAIQYKHRGAFELFVRALEEAGEHPRHLELAALLKEWRHKEVTCNATMKNQRKQQKGIGREVGSKSEERMQPLHGTSDTCTSRPNVPEVFQTLEELELEKLKWLQRRVHFRSSPEMKVKWLVQLLHFHLVQVVVFTSRTNYNEQRRILYDGVVLHDGKPVFLVLFNDFLVILRVRLHSEQPNENLTSYEWFSENTYVATKPNLLHLLEARKQDSSPQHNQFTIQVLQSRSCFEACSKAARDAWVSVIKCAVESCVRAREKCRCLTAAEAASSSAIRNYGEMYQSSWSLSVTVLKAVGLPSVLGLLRPYFCCAQLGQNKPCRTHTVVGRDHAVWNTIFEFSNFSTMDSLVIRVMQENNFKPNDTVGSVEIPVSQMPQSLCEMMEIPLMQEHGHESNCTKIKLCIGLSREINV